MSIQAIENPGNDIFGQIISGAQVEGAIITTLDRWFLTYLYEMEIQLNRNQRHVLVSPRSWTTYARIDEVMPEDQLPAAIVVAPGLAEKPVRDGSGNYRAPWRAGLGVIVSAKDYDSTNELAKLYSAAARAILLQKGSLGGFALEVEWVDEKYDLLPIPDRTRSIVVAQVDVTVWVEYVVNKFLGPPDPYDPDPYGQPGSVWPTAHDVIIEIQRREKEGVDVSTIHVHA